MASPWLEEKFDGDGEDNSDKDRTDELCAASYDHAGANLCSQDLSDAHGQARSEINVALPKKEDEGTEVAGEVDYFGIAGRFRQIEAEDQNVGHRPKCAGAGSKEAVVKADAQSEEDVEPGAAHAGGDVGRAHLRPKQDDERDGDEQDWNRAFQG